MDKYLSYLFERKFLAIVGIVAVTVLGAVLFNQSTQPSTEATVNDPTSTCTLAAAIPSLAPGQSFQPSFTLTNKGTNTWTATTTPWAYPLYPGSGFAIYATNDTNSLSTWGTTRLPLTQNVAPGASVTVTPPALTAPTTPGSYSFSFQMGEKGFGRFGTVCSQTVTVKSPTSSAPTINVSAGSVYPADMGAITEMYPIWSTGNATSCVVHISSATVAGTSTTVPASISYAEQFATSLGSTYALPPHFKDGLQITTSCNGFGSNCSNGASLSFLWMNKCSNWDSAHQAYTAAGLRISQAVPGVSITCMNGTNGPSTTVPLPVPSGTYPSCY